MPIASWTRPLPQFVPIRLSVQVCNLGLCINPKCPQLTNGVEESTKDESIRLEEVPVVDVLRRSSNSEFQIPCIQYIHV